MPEPAGFSRTGSWVGRTLGFESPIRHAAAMACDDAEEARDLLRHRNSTVTRTVYRAHFGDRRREALRARMEARMEAANGNRPQQAPEPGPSEVVDLQALRHSEQRAAADARPLQAGGRPFEPGTAHLRPPPLPTCNRR